LSRTFYTTQQLWQDGIADIVNLDSWRIGGSVSEITGGCHCQKVSLCFDESYLLKLLRIVDVHDP